MEEKTKVESGLTARALILGVTIMFFSILFQSFYIWRGVPTFYNPWPTEDTIGIQFAAAGYTFAVLFILTLITKKIPLTRQEVAVVTAMAIISTIPFVANMVHVHIQMMFGARMPAIEAVASKYYLDWVIPGPGAWDIYNNGGDIFKVFMAAGSRLFVWIWLAIVVGLFTYFIGLPFRRSYIDVQNLPYPYLQPVVVTLDTALARDNEKPRILNFSNPDTKWFMIGLILGILAYLIFIPRSYPWGKYWPAPIAYEAAGYGHFWFWDIQKILFPVIPWYNWTYIDLPPELVGSLIFLPMDVIASTVGLWIFMYLVGPPIFAALGFYKGKPWWELVTQQCVGTFCYTDPSPNWWIGSQYVPWLWIAFGGLLFYGLVTTIFNPKPFIATIKGIWSKVEGEEKEPLPYKIMWGLVILFTILFIGTMLTYGISIGQAIIVVIIAALLQLSAMRTVADFGFQTYWSSSWYGNANTATLNLGGKLGVTQPNTTGAFYTAVIGDSMLFGYSACISTSAMGLAGYKIADIYKARNRDIMIAQVIAIVGSLILAYVLSLAVTGAIGFKNAASRPNWRSGYLDEAARLASNVAAGVENQPDPSFGTYKAWIAGGIIITILVALRTFIPWWPFHPVAFVLLGTFPEWVKIGNAVVVAFIIKLVVLKIGGTALYEKFTKPVAGIIAGSLIGRVLLLIATIPGGPLAF